MPNNTFNLAPISFKLVSGEARGVAVSLSICDEPNDYVISTYCQWNWRIKELQKAAASNAYFYGYVWLYEGKPEETLYYGTNESYEAALAEYEKWGEKLVERQFNNWNLIFLPPQQFAIEVLKALQPSGSNSF